MFVVLALVFGVGFVVFGVGGGIPGTSLGDILRSGGGSSGPSESKLRSEIQANPKDAAAYRELATKLQQDGNTQEAITTLEQLTKLRPKVSQSLAELGSLYLTQANRYQTQTQNAQVAFSQANPGAFIPSLTAPNGQPVLNNPITSPAVQQASTEFNQASANAQAAYSKAVATYKQLVKATPAGPEQAQVELQLGQTAQSAGDYPTAIAAYRKTLRLAPTDPNAPAIRQEIKVLTQQAKQQAAQQAAQTSSSG